MSEQTCAYWISFAGSPPQTFVSKLQTLSVVPPQNRWTTTVIFLRTEETLQSVLCNDIASRSGRSSGLAKTILQGTVKRGRRQGGQRKRWEDNIRNGQAWISASPRGQWRTGKNGENWLQNHLWCPNDPRSYGIDDDGQIINHFCGTESCDAQNSYLRGIELWGAKS